MDHHGQQFGVNLFRLWEVSTIDLPAFATRMVYAGDDFYEISDPHIEGGPGTARILAAWSQLANDVDRTLVDSVDHTYAAADALMAIAKAYAETDAAAKAEYEARCTDEITKHLTDPSVVVYDDPYDRPQIVGDHP